MPEITARNHGIVVSAPGKPLHVNGDAVRLTQVVGNLVSNAAKFTPNGGRIEVQISVADELATIVVRDTGIGIAQRIPVSCLRAVRPGAKPASARPRRARHRASPRAAHRRDAPGPCRGAERGRANLGREFIVRIPLLQRAAATLEEKATMPSTEAGFRTPDPHRRRFRGLPRQPGSHVADRRQRRAHGTGRCGCA